MITLSKGDIVRIRHIKDSDVIVNVEVSHQHSKINYGQLPPVLHEQIKTIEHYVGKHNRMVLEQAVNGFVESRYDLLRP